MSPGRHDKIAVNETPKAVKPYVVKHRSYSYIRYADAWRPRTYASARVCASVPSDRLPRLSFVLWAALEHYGRRKFWFKRQCPVYRDNLVQISLCKTVLPMSKHCGRS
jgi:hypothetical protein